MNIQTLKVKDEIITSKGSGVVTRINDKSIWLDDKRYSLESVLKDIKNILYNDSPDLKIDWTNKTEVDGFYHSFKRWTFYISMGCKYKVEICEVKNGMLLHNGEYYVPALSNINDDWCAKDIKKAEDGLYYVHLYKRVLSYYEHQGGNIVNVFYIKEATSVSEQASLKIRSEWDFYTTPIEQTVKHIKTLNPQKLLSKELDFIKSNMLLFFQEFLPFKASNGVCINKWEFFKNPLSCSKGLLYINNSYHGHNPSGLQYGLMFDFHPSFSNECNYSASSYIKDFSITALEQIAVEIKKSIDRYCKL